MTMNNQDIFQLIVERLKTEPFLKGFKFRKRDSSFIQQEGGLRRHIELDHCKPKGRFFWLPLAKYIKHPLLLQTKNRPFDFIF